MTKGQYQQLCTYMEQCLAREDAAHDKEHCYRVLYHALDIVAFEGPVNHDVLIAACLLHDIGRAEQYRNKTICHAEAGSKKAAAYLSGWGWESETVGHIAECIYTHRYRSEHPPKTLEAKILFDADKLDVCGAMGIARTLFYQGKMGQMLYSVSDEKRVLPGNISEKPSFFREYNRKLQYVPDRLYTRRAKEIALQRRKTLDDFYWELFNDTRLCYTDGQKRLQELLSDLD